MIDWVITIGWCIGWLWAIRFIAGMAYEGLGDPVDVVFGCIMGLLLGWAWPLLLAARLIYVGFIKYGPSDEDWIKKVFPGPKPVESRWDREQKKLREKEKELALYKAWAASENAGKEGYTFDDYLVDQSM